MKTFLKGPKGRFLFGSAADFKREGRVRDLPGGDDYVISYGSLKAVGRDFYFVGPGVNRIEAKGPFGCGHCLT